MTAGTNIQTTQTQNNSAARPMEPRDRIMELTYPKLFWLFMLGSVVGLVLEVVYHAIVFGGYESRVGLVWGPFSPLYGAGAVVFTLVLNRLGRAPIGIVFLVSMIFGSAVEYATSWWLETFFGAIAWDYSDTFGNIHGRVNLMFALMWGCLGLVWAKLFMPALEKAAARIDWDNVGVSTLTIFFTIFMALNIVVTVQAFARDSARANGQLAATPIDQFYDSQFSSEWMDTHFHMTIKGTNTEVIS